MAVKVLILEDNPVARSFLCRVVRESFSDTIVITEAGDLESARKQISLTGGSQGLHGVDPFKLILVDLELPDGNGMELLAELAAYPATKIGVRPRAGLASRRSEAMHPRIDPGQPAQRPDQLGHVHPRTPVDLRRVLLGHHVHAQRIHERDASPPQLARHPLPDNGQPH